MSLRDFINSLFAQPPAPDPTQFTSLYELQSFLKQSSIDKNQYVQTTYDCDDFARSLQREALQWRGGRILNVQYEVLPDGRGHALNTAIIGNDWFKIEPQTDQITRLCSLD